MPRTVEDAVSYLIENMSEKDKKDVMETSYDMLCVFHIARRETPTACGSTKVKCFC